MTVAVTSLPDPLEHRYYACHCRHCDALTGTPHRAFCRNGHGIDWQKLRAHILRRDGYQCRYCGWEPPAEDRRDGHVELLHIDHVLPRSAGGRDVPWNLVTACETCNLRKSAAVLDWISRWEADRSDHEAAWEANRLLEIELAIEEAAYDVEIPA